MKKTLSRVVLILCAVAVIAGLGFTGTAVQATCDIVSSERIGCCWGYTDRFIYECADGSFFIGCSGTCSGPPP